MDTQSSSDVEIQTRWLVRIRWVAVASLLTIFLGADLLLGMGLPSNVICVALGLSALSNLTLSRIQLGNQRRFLLWGGSALVFDVLVLALLLYVSGGYANPFSMMFLAYVVLAAAVLDTRWTWWVFIVSSASFVALFFYHEPVHQLSMRHHVHPAAGVENGFSLHLHGMLVAYLVIGSISAWFLTRMNREIGEQAAQIRELQEVESDRKRLLSLATLTGGVAHELATPIATLSMIGDDLVAAFGDDPVWREDMQSVKSELNRCTSILARMRGTSSELQGETSERFCLSDVIGEVVSQFGHAEQVSFKGDYNPSFDLISLRRSLVASLTALFRNGIQASECNAEVVCYVETDDESVQFTVVDSGQGMTEEVRKRIGEPFFTSKAPGEGVGLGVYLTRLFALQVGGALRFVSQTGVGTHAILKIPRGI